MHDDPYQLSGATTRVITRFAWYRIIGMTVTSGVESMEMNRKSGGTGMLVAALISAVGASISIGRRKSRLETTRPTPVSEVSQSPNETSARMLMRPIMGRLKPLTGAEVVDRVHKLIEMRSRIDRLAWNSLAAGSLKGPPSTRVGDWTDRCMLLVSIGIAFEDMPEVLGRGLDEPESVDAWYSLIHRTAEAYDALACAYIPPAWTEHSAAGGGLSDSLMWRAWTGLCDEVAGILGLEPRYGRNIAPSE